MKNFIKRLSSLMLALMLICSLGITAFASGIEFKGFTDGFDFEPGSEYTETDLFDNFKGVMPGDVLTEEITFKNSAKDCDFVQLYIRAVAHDEQNNPLSEKVAEKESVATMTDFLSQLSMKVWNGKTLIYEASPDELDGLSENVFLGTFRTGETTTLTVELTVPLELGNEYANRVGEVDWVFHVEAYNESQLSVRKVWSDGNSTHAKDSITVNLLKDGKVESTAILNAKNGWAYTFDELVEGYTWTVEEAQVPAGYTVSYETVGTSVTIINTKNVPTFPPNIPTPPNKPTPPPEEPTPTPTEPVPTPEEPMPLPIEPTPEEPTPLPEEPLDIIVTKVWSNDSTSTRPDYVTVTLYNGNIAYETVKLSKDNDWTYHWEDLSASGNWQVTETNIPKGYTPSYSVSGNVTTITNTYKLIQTGQLNWPIAVLGGVGIALVALGGAMVLIKKKRDNV